MNTQNIRQVTGEDFTHEVLMYGADGTTPQNVSAWAAVNFVVHAYGDPTAAYVTKTLGSGVTAVNPTPTQAFNWAFDCYLARADTVNMPAGQYEWYLERADGSLDAVPAGGCFTLLRK